MARVNSKLGRKPKRRERTLGQAIALALAVTLGVALLIFVGLMCLPGSALHQFYLLAHYNASNTLRGSLLFQKWMDEIDRQEVVVTALSLLCGGLALGWLAPSYTSRRRLLLSAAGISLGLVAVLLAFLWPTAILNQNQLNANAGGTQDYVTAPFYVIRNQILWGIVWTAVCVLGAWGGRILRTRYAKPLLHPHQPHGVRL